MKRASLFTGMIMLALAAMVQAQVTTATLYGTVSDPAGAAVAGSDVTVTNEATGISQAATTDERGEFTVTFLPFGRYTIQIRARGFKSEARAGVDLAAGQRIRLSFALTVGEIGETIKVTSDAPLINTVNPELKTSLSTAQLAELPTLRRDWTNLLNIGTGVSLQGNGGLSINGLASQGFSFTIDGSNANANPEMASSLTMMDGPNFIKGVSLEAINEVNITKGIASADLGSALGGNLNVITKSGTNEFHGSLFENHQSAGLNARNPFLANKPKLIFHQFGGSVGGPVIKNKLFFFGVFEGYRQNSFTAFNATVATKELRDRAIAAVPAYKQWFDRQPLPNQPYAAGANSAQYIGAGTAQASDNHYVAHDDYQITPASRVSARYTHSDPYRLSPRAAETNQREFLSHARSATASFTTARSAWSSETRFGYNYTFVNRLGNFLTLGIPLILTNLGFGDASAEARLLKNFGHTWSVDEVIATTRGRHTLKFGGSYSGFRQTRDVAELTYTGLDDFLANRPSAVALRFDLNPYHLRGWNGALFIHDDFKLRPNLVLNLGLRHDYFSVPNERDRRIFNRNEPNGFGSLRDPDSAYEADYNNFSPRFGFAWTVDASAKTVVSGGFGVFYNQPSLQMTLNTVKNSLDSPGDTNVSRAEALALKINYPITTAAAMPLFSGANAPWTGTVLNPEHRTAYSMQWNLTVQRQLTRARALETSYVGNRGVKLMFLRQQNVIDRVTGVRPMAGFG
ncbi:MAG: TonB-dependent receptor [Blastocatellia bacterium]